MSANQDLDFLEQVVMRLYHLNCDYCNDDICETISDITHKIQTLQKLIENENIR